MIRKLFQELFLGPESNIATRTAEAVGSKWRAFYLDKLFALLCIGASWTMFIRLCRSQRKFLGSEDPRYLYMRNRRLRMTDTLHALLSDNTVDIHHLNNDFFSYGFAPYAYIDRDDYRLGESEWTYRDIEAPSVMSAGEYGTEVPVIESAEFEYFKDVMSMCGRFPISHLRQMFNHCEILELEENEVLFEIGDPDEFVYMVIHGQVQVLNLDEKKVVRKLRLTQRGDKIMSLFSFVDVLTGNAKPLKTVEAYAHTPSRVVKFPVQLFREYMQLHEKQIPDVICRLIRKIYEMNYLMLHRILGLALIAIADPPSPLLLSASGAQQSNLHLPDYVIPSPNEDLPEQIRQEAINSFKSYLGLPEDTDVLDDCLVFTFDPDQRPLEDVLTGHPVIDNENIKFKYIFKGQVELFRINSNTTQEDVGDPETEPILTHESLYILFEGEGVGGLSTFAEIENFLFMRIMRRSIIVATTHNINHRLFQQYPAAILPMANQIIKRLSPTIRKMDFGIEWALAEGGKSLFVTGSEVRDTFVVLGGRLRSYMIDPKGKLKYYGEYEKNDWIGLVEALVRFPVRSKTVVAVRDTELCKIPIDFITFLKTTFPMAAFSLMGYIGHRVGKYRFFQKSQTLSPEMQLVAGTSRRCASIALIPTFEEMPYVPFAMEIKMHHDLFGSTMVITWKTVQDQFNLETLDFEHEYAVHTWVMAMLSLYDLVVFVCSNHVKLWTEMCIKHSEVIITLGVQDRPIDATKLEKMMVKRHLVDRKRKELVILHKLEITERKDRYLLPRDTIAWLEQRPWISCHHHLRIPAEAWDYQGLVSTVDIDLHYKSLLRKPHKHSDMSRFCRWLIGKSVGLVFTGGGARMAVQAGVLKTIVDHDVPIDMVGGVGTGYVVGALYAIYEDMDKVLRYTEEIFRGIGDASKTAFDITIPYISPVQGRALLSLVMKFFTRSRMEDTWTPNFCLTCDISKQDLRVHRDGPFWVYVRASLANFLGAPPINDPKDGGFIVDGSFANPIPEDIMRKFGAEYVLVINTTDGKTFDSSAIDPAKDIWTNLWRLFLLAASRLNFKTPDFVRINEMINRTQKIMYSEAVEANTDGLFVAFIKPNAEIYAVQKYKDFNRLLHLGHQYAQIILKDCPLKGVPFHEFWTNMRQTSTKMEQKQGRGIRYNVNEDFWESIDARIFERDEKLEELKLEEQRSRYGPEIKGKASDSAAIKNALRKERFEKAFRHYVFSKIDPHDRSRVSDPPEEEEDNNNEGHTAESIRTLVQP